MTRDRWLRVRAIFEAAVDRPEAEREAFVADRAAGDDKVRREVETLLRADASAVSVLDRLHVGVRHIGPYEIVSFVGAGTMGEVYRARDPKLNRDVALKILPPLFALDPDRLGRFRREAQLLAALNHPNIGAIYGFEDSSGVQALVLEMVDGRTLANLLANGPLPLREALVIAVQIAEAMEAAHEKGIIHRDLKPANIKIDGAGTVKVLDFGLAKAASPDAVRQDVTASHAGLIVGTASYMSPEQARGQIVDKRADIWAFGCVLYEMLTGRLAFTGDTVSDTIAMILEREADWSALPNTTPPSVQRLLRRCLVKDSRLRLRDIGDARIALVSSDDDVRVEAPPPSLRWLPWAGAVAMVVGIALWPVSWLATTPYNPLANARFVPLTTWEGAEEAAEISPDGQFVAFLADHSGEFDIWLSQIGSGNFTNLTHDVPPLAPAGAIVRKLGFTGDGTEIWFNPAARRPLLLLPLTGGSSRAFLGAGANTPAWSPGGERLVYFGKPPDGADPMYVADSTGANQRELVPPQSGLHSNNPVWSPDGKWIYFVSGPEPQDEVEMDVWRVSSDGGVPERLTEQHAAVNFLAAIDPRTLLYVARDEDGAGPWLWALDIERKQKHRVPSGVDQYTSVAASRDGRRIVATVANPSATLWRVPLLDRLASEQDAQPYALPVPAGLALAPRANANSLFFLSARGTGDGLWKIDNGQASRVWRHANGPISEPVAVSHDGKRLAVVTMDGGKRRLSVMLADGTMARTVAPSIEIEGAAAQSNVDWSPDGGLIVAGGRDAQGPALFLIPVDGGTPQRLVEGKWRSPVWSPDGKLIVYVGRSIVGQVPLEAIRPDGQRVEMPDVRVRPGGYRFLPDGSRLVYLPDIHVRDFWLFDLRTQKTRRLTELDNRGTLRTFDITPDGKHIVFDRLRQNSNVVLIERR